MQQGTSAMPFCLFHHPSLLYKLSLAAIIPVAILKLLGLATVSVFAGYHGDIVSVPVGKASVCLQVVKHDAWLQLVHKCNVVHINLQGLVLSTLGLFLVL